jgi:methyl-accepting chemotaxis protein
VEILINGVPISFQLEREENAGDIVAGLESWLAAGGHAVQEVRIDGEIVASADDATSSSPTPEAWRDQEVARITSVEIVATSRYQEIIDQQETVINYCDLLRRVAGEGSDEQLVAIREELPHIEEGLSRIVPDLAGVISAVGSDRDKLARRAGEISTILQQRQREYLDPVRELRQTIAALQQILPAFEQIPVQLQSGQEREALEMVAGFAELTGRLLRIVPIAATIRPEVPSPESAESSLNGLLRELEGALESRDMVLVGDLMEYELLPLLTSLVGEMTAALDGEAST